MKHFFKTLGNKVIGFCTEEDSEYISNPDDFIEISLEKKEELLQQQTNGGEILFLNNDIVCIIKPEIPEGMAKPEFDYNQKIWIETATEEEITTYIGNLVTDLLYEALEIGCEVTVNGEKHQQSLDDNKRKALNERVSGFNLAEELGTPISQVAWPFKDDGTDTVVMSVDEFKKMTLYCLGYGEKCYLAAELLKAKRKIDSTLDDFYAELANVDTISLENL